MVGHERGGVITEFRIPAAGENVVSNDGSRFEGMCKLIYVDFQQTGKDGAYIPKGAYYLNYNYSREPGKKTGDWFVADSGSVAMGVLAVAARCDDPTEKQRCLDSVRAFAKLVMENYVSKDGGITDGIWSSYAGPWWCSSATFSGTETAARLSWSAR